MSKHSGRVEASCSCFLWKMELSSYMRSCWWEARCHKMPSQWWYIVFQLQEILLRSPNYFGRRQLQIPIREFGCEWQCFWRWRLQRMFSWWSSWTRICRLTVSRTSTRRWQGHPICIGGWWCIWPQNMADETVSQQRIEQPAMYLQLQTVEITQSCWECLRDSCKQVQVRISNSLSCNYYIWFIFDMEFEFY